MSPDLQVELRPVAALVPYAANARTHPPEQVAQLAASISSFGFNVPVLVDETGVLVAGHGRVLAAQALGLGEVPVIRLGHLSPEQARAYRLADNRIALGGGWDEALLAEELRALQLAEVDLGLTGFDDAELARLLGEDPFNGTGLAGNADAPAPEPPEEAVSRPGDLWLLGAHRLLCGDATSQNDVMRLLDGARPHLMVTDPPYGVTYNPAWRNAAGISHTGRTGVVLNDDRADWRDAWALFPGDAAYVWHAGVHARTVIESLEAAGFGVRSQIIWAKPRLVLGRGDYHWQHEPCLYAVRRGATGHWQGARDQTTLWAMAASGAEDAATVHGTQKPVEAMRRPMVNNSAPGEWVYEPFGGSGTTILAGQRTGRQIRAIELAPAYVDLAVARWRTLHPDMPVTLADDGRDYDAVAAARQEVTADAA